jgi:hypothetical protein
MASGDGSGGFSSEAAARLARPTELTGEFAIDCDHAAEVANTLSVMPIAMAAKRRLAKTVRVETFMAQTFMASAIAGTSNAAFQYPLALPRKPRRGHDSPRESVTSNPSAP